jgi:hypothetical protein
LEKENIDRLTSTEEIAKAFLWLEASDANFVRRGDRSDSTREKGKQDGSIYLL